MFPTPSDQGPLLWRRFIVVRIDRDMLVRDDETPEPFVKRFLAASSSNGTGVRRLAKRRLAAHNYRHLSHRIPRRPPSPREYQDVGIAQFGSVE